jgi:hypothetical protein
MSNPTTPFSWQMPQSTDLVTDLPADFEVFGQAVATSMADLLGGTTGQILSKTSGTDMDFTWIANDQGDITNIGVTAPINGGGSSGSVTIGINDATTSVKGAVQLSDSTSTTSSVLAATPTAVKSAYDLAAAAIATSTLTTAGDTLYRNATVPARLGIGTAGQVLTVNSGATAPQWSTPAGATAFPAFSAYSSTNQTISGGTYTKITFGGEDYDTAGNFASNRFTPTTAGYYQINFGGYVDGSGATNYGSARLYFNGSAIRACNFTDTTNDYSPVLADVIYFNGSTDYLEVFTYINGGGTVVGNASAPRYTYFSGVGIRS